MCPRFLGEAVACGGIGEADAAGPLFAAGGGAGIEAALLGIPDEGGDAYLIELMPPQARSGP